jgi:hypothetical protein
MDTENLPVSEPEDDEIDIELRSPHDVGYRLIALTVLAERLSLEFPPEVLTPESQYERETERFEWYSWAKKELDGYLLPDELIYLKTPGSKSTARQIIDFGYSTEQAVALAWALNIIVGKHLAMSVSEEFIQQFKILDRWRPKPWDRLNRKVRNLKLRSEQVIWDERDRISTARIWWLANSVDTAQSTGIGNLTDEIRAAGFFENCPDFFPQPQAIAQMDEEVREARISSMGSVVKALTWVCGMGESWDDVPWDDLDAVYGT